ncbi:MAG TPA: hypothetical protein VFN94_03040 [Nitrospiria bacterium]|nr:hypothetical protein [Nitrospiria bacterium]
MAGGRYAGELRAAVSDAFVDGRAAPVDFSAFFCHHRSLFHGHRDPSGSR